MIRPAKTEDLPALLEMGRAFNEEAGYSETIPFCEASFQLNLAIFATANLLLVVEKDGRPVGMGAADVAPAICNSSVRVGREAFWYITPAYRKGERNKDNGKKLLAALECAAKQQGASYFDVIAEEGKRSEALARIYRAASFRPTERIFRKELA